MIKHHSQFQFNSSGEFEIKMWKKRVYLPCSICVFFARPSVPYYMSRTAKEIFTELDSGEGY